MCALHEGMLWAPGGLTVCRVCAVTCKPADHELYCTSKTSDNVSMVKRTAELGTEDTLYMFHAPPMMDLRRRSAHE